LGVPSALTTGRPAFVMSAVNAVYQKICCAICPCAGTGPASPNVMPVASFGAYFFIQSTYFVSAYTAAGELVAPPRETEAPTGVHLSAAYADAPFVDRQPVRDADIGCPAIDSHASVKRHPSDGSFLAVVHVTVDRLAVDRLHVIGEELGDVLVRAPVEGHAEARNRTWP
jgi:hypothetical protein